MVAVMAAVGAATIEIIKLSTSNKKKKTFVDGSSFVDSGYDGGGSGYNRNNLSIYMEVKKI